jgi:hypothetical protein
MTREAEEDLLFHATEVSLTPGFNVRRWPETTFAVGSELPVTRAGERVLREFHRTAGHLAHKHRGTIERFTGNGLMVFFNAPASVPRARRP